jgi:HemY protein
MRLLTVLLVLLLAALGVGYWLDDSGYILVRIGDIAAETTLWGSLVALTAIAVVLRLIYLTLRAFLRGSSWLLGWTGQRKVRGLRVLSETAALALLQGKWVLAQRDFLQAKKLGDIDLASNLGLARAAHELGNKEVEVSALKAAKSLLPDTDQSIGNIMMTWQIAQGESADVIEILEPIHLAGECSGQRLVVLARAYLNEHRWLDVKKLWPTLEKQKLLKKEVFEQDFERVWAARLLAESNIADALKIIPKALKSNVAIYSAWVDFLLLVRTEDALAAIEYALAAKWDDQLVLCFGKTHGSNVEAQLIQGKKWLKKNPDNVALLMALGRLAIAQRQVSLARDYFESALAQAPEGDSIRSEIYRELGQACHGLGDAQSALQYLLKA